MLSYISFKNAENSLLDQSCIVWFQKISIPPPQRVTGNSEGEGSLKGQNFKGMYEPKLEFPEGWGGSNQKNPLWGEYRYFLKQHILIDLTQQIIFVLPKIDIKKRN